MFPGLNFLINCGESEPPEKKFILLSESNNDGSFLIHHFLSMYIKGGFQVCFIALVQSFAHYCSVAQKLGVNLAEACNKRQVVYIDGLKMISEALALDRESDRLPETVADENPFYNIRDKDFTLHSLYNHIRTSVQKASGPFLLAVDDLSILVTIGVTVHDIYNFVHYCTTLMCYSPSVSEGCFVALVHCDSNADDENSMLLWKRLCHIAHLEMHVEGLSSGYCKEVHGQIVITWREPDQLKSKPHNKTVTQYKIQDRMVTFFAPGTSKAVL